MQKAEGCWALCLALRGKTWSSGMQVGSILDSMVQLQKEITRFGYMGKNSLNFICFLEKQENKKQLRKHLQTSCRGQGTDKQWKDIPTSSKLMPIGKLPSSSSSSQKRGWKRPVSWGVKKWRVKTTKASRLTSQSRRIIILSTADCWMRKKGVFPRSCRGGNCREEQLMPDDFHTLCCPSTSRKPESTSMQIPRSLWHGLPPPTATHIQQLQHFAPEIHFFNSRGSRWSPAIASYRYCT